MAVFDVEAWLDRLKTEYNVPEDVIPHAEIRNGFLRQDEFSRRSQQLDAAHRDRMATEDKFHDDLKSAEGKLKLVQQLESQYGSADQWSDALALSIGTQYPQLGEGTRGRMNGDDRYSLDQVQKLINDAITTTEQKFTQQIGQYGNAAAVMIDFMSEAPSRFQRLYGKEFPKKEFGEFFQKSGTNDPYAAFEIFEKPYLKEHLETKHKHEMEEAEKRGYQSAMSKYGHVESLDTTLPPGVLMTNLDQNNAGYGARTNPNPNPAPATGTPPTPVPAPTPDPNQSQPVSREARKSSFGKAYTEALSAANTGKVPGATPGS